MMKAGIVVHIIPATNIFIVDVGWGQLRFFFADKDYKTKDIVFYEETYHDSFDSNEIEPICRFDDCDYQGNIRFDVYRPNPSESDVVIARRDLFVYWNEYWDGMQTFDIASNSLLFLSHVAPRYPLPNEKDWLEAYSDAKKKVEELNIPQMIEELKVEVFNNSWTRRGSDNVLISHSKMHYNYSYHYDYLGDHYLDAIFPSYSEELYYSKDDECEYINPKYTKWKYIHKPDGSVEHINATFEGIDIDLYCANKTNELRQVALKNYESYNKDAHIVSLAYSHINSSHIYNYNKENQLILKMKGIAEIIWGFKHQKLIEQMNKDNYRSLIENNNTNHRVPYFPDEEQTIV